MNIAFLVSYNFAKSTLSSVYNTVKNTYYFANPRNDNDRQIIKYDNIKSAIILGFGSFVYLQPEITLFAIKKIAIFAWLSII